MQRISRMFFRFAEFRLKMQVMFHCFLLKSPHFIFHTLLHANLVNVLKIRVKYPACILSLSASDGIHDMSTLPTSFPRFLRMFSRLAVAVQRACLSLTLLMHYGYFIYCFWVRGCLSQGEGGAKRKI